ncbi:MAG: hypothetical protein GYB65_13965 [Chloroflexi bacterium]|nr:hypothetical protein [Chloroflexota bacterium]
MQYLVDPSNLDETLEQLTPAFNLPDQTCTILRRIIAMFPRPIEVMVDEATALLYQDLAMADKFSFDMDTDALVLFSWEPEVIIDAFIEMAMYLNGFATMLGNREEWIIEFTIGTWKPVKNRIKRQLGIQVHDHPRMVVGLPPNKDQTPADDPYPFRKLVSSYDIVSFHQMVVLAARDDVAVYFPPETHSKVLAVYVYMRRAIQEVAQGLSLGDYEEFNTRLLEAVQKLQNLFNPSRLSYPQWLEQFEQTEMDLGTLPPQRQDHDNPFEEFIEELFSDDDAIDDADDDFPF